MAADDTRPTAVAIRSYMRNSGWRESTQGTVGSVWTKGDAKFCVPHEGDDPDLIQRALVRLASAEGRTPEETAAAIAEHKAAPLVMPADEFAAVETVAEACGPTITAGGSVPDDSGRDLPSAHGQAQPPAATVTDQDVNAVFAAIADYWKRVREPFQVWPSSGLVRAMLEAVAPRLVAAERERAERAEAKLEHAKAALAGDNEGIRLWMLDCNALAAKYWDRVQSAEAKLAGIGHLCREPSHVLLRGTDAGIEGTDYVRADAILAIIGTEEEPFTPDCGQPTDADRAIAARATGGGIRSREVQPRFSEEGTDHA